MGNLLSWLLHFLIYDTLCSGKETFLYVLCYTSEYNFWCLNFIAILFCMTFSTKESKVDTNFQLFLLRNTELSHKTQQKKCVIKTWKIVDIPLPFLIGKKMKNICLKLDLPDWCTFICTLYSKFCWYVIYLQFTKI